MAITQPSYPVETNELVTHVGAYVDSQDGGGLYDVIEAGNKTGAYNPALTASRSLVHLTATGNVTMTPTFEDDGAEALIEFTQDSTGGWTLTVDGRELDVDTTAEATTAVRLYWRTGVIDIEQPGGGATGPQGPTGPAGETGGSIPVVILTQVEYDALSPPDDETLYVVVG